MRRVVALGLALVLAAGCASRGSVPQVTEPGAAVPGPVQGAAGGGASGPVQGAAGAGTGSPDPGASTKPAPLGLAAVTGAPVDWAQAFPPREPRALPPLTENACGTDGTGLTVDLRAAEWAPHPLAAEPFWTPSVVVVACNATPTPMKSPRLTLRFHHGTGVGAQLPDLAPGQAVGPIRLFGTRGVPESVGATWQEHGERWPALMAEVLEGERVIAEVPVRRALAGARAEAQGGGSPFPAAPTLDDLRKLSSSQTDLGEQGQFFLYAPDMIRTIQTDDYCGAMSGQTNASAEGWAVYRSVAGGAPEKLLGLGMHGFPGGRGMTVEAVPALKTIFFLFADYGSCANPTWYEVHAYDQTSKTAYRPQMKREDGQVGAATVTSYSLEPDGTLTNKGYNNADGKWHIYTYKWDGAARTWIFASHVTQ